MAITGEVRAILAARLEAILPHLDERQRRLLLGAEARVLGHGGIKAVAQAAGVREATVSSGVDELDAGVVASGRVRRPGGGRKPVTAHDPDLMTALRALVEPDERGDPMSPLRWTTKSTRNLAAQLTRQGHPVSHVTVAELLRDDGFSLQGNAKVLEGYRHPDRDTQFRYLNEQAKQHQNDGQPVISVDAKKKEQIGPFAAGGRDWRPAGRPVQTRSHDFPDPEQHIAIPYGVYDLTTNTGWVNVGTDHDTATFAVESIRRWWNNRGRTDYPNADRLLITADAGGSNNHRNHTWKAELAALATETGLDITVCHFPPGTSKWNKIEHRLFSQITLNWQARPLTSHHIVVQTIAATTTRTGLAVHAQLDTGTYNLGNRISTKHLNSLGLHRHDWHPDWNYTLTPQQPTTTPPATTPRPDLSWLHHPAITGMSNNDLTTLITLLTALQTPHHRGVKPTLNLTDRLLATLLHHRLHLPQTTLTTLFAISRENLNRNIQTTRKLLHQAQRTLPTSTTHLHTLNDLHTHATNHGITPTHQKTTS